MSPLHSSRAPCWCFQWATLRISSFPRTDGKVHSSRSNRAFSSLFLLLFLVKVSSHSPLCPSFGLMILTLAQKIFFTIGQQLTTFLKLLGPGFYWTILLDFTFSLYVFSLVDLFPDMIEIGLVHCFTNKNLPRRQLPDSISFHFSHFCLF